MVNRFEDKVIVLPIVGMPGIGKTVFAHVVSSELKKDVTYSMIWISLASEFDIKRVMTSIIEHFTHNSCNLTELNLIQALVKQFLQGKKILLVLDDYFSRKQEDWKLVSVLLKDISPGSVILITTQCKMVSSIVGSVPEYELQCMSDEECWNIMRQRELLGNNIDGKKMEVFGKEISKKWKGVPMIANALGRVLYYNPNEKEWDLIKKKELWDLANLRDEVSQALTLSLIYLPDHLRYCFGYCALFPPDHEFEKEDMVMFWMAEGFIVPVNGKRLGDVGSEYFDDLCSRCFFQLSSTPGKKQEKYKMHAVIHLLAQSVGMCLRTKVDGSHCNSFDKNFRQLSLHLDSLDYMDLAKLIGLRSLILKKGNSQVIHGLVKTCRVLRVLDCSYGIDQLPTSIGALVHLQYLDISNGKMVELPEQLTQVFCLQTLKLRNCSQLFQLHSNFFRLINLLHFEFDVHRIERMPLNFGSLVNLEVLSGLVVSDGEGYGLEQLWNMNNLRGSLHINKLENVSKGIDVADSILNKKQGLEKLVLQWENSLVKSVQTRDVIGLVLQYYFESSLSFFEYLKRKQGIIYGDHFILTTRNSPTLL